LSEESDSIEWTPSFVLTENHFLGTPDPEDPHDASSHTGVNYFFEHELFEDKKRFKVKVKKIWTKAYFFPSQSWFRRENSTEINLPKLLKHEQGHFDLVEKFARKFDRKLKNKFRNKTSVYNKNSTSEPVNEIKNTIQHFFVELNEKVKKGHEIYDKETNHGTINEQQEKYNLRFAQLRKEST